MTMRLLRFIHGVGTLQGYATDTEMFLITPMLEYPGLLVCVLFLPDGIMYRRKIFVSKCKFGRSRTFARTQPQTQTAITNGFVVCTFLRQC